jgi:hypothetical protein
MTAIRRPNLAHRCRWRASAIREGECRFDFTGDKWPMSQLTQVEGWAANHSRSRSATNSSDWMTANSVTVTATFVGDSPIASKPDRTSMRADRRRHPVRRHRRCSARRPHPLRCRDEKCSRPDDRDEIEYAPSRACIKSAGRSGTSPSSMTVASLRTIRAVVVGGPRVSRGYRAVVTCANHGNGTP